MNKTDSANLILKLYELRRDATMREARSWMLGFMPENAQDILQAMVKTESSAYYRMVVSYWDMAASFVNHGAIDEEMCADVNAEHFIVFSKIEPFLSEIRELTNNPHYLKNLESLIMKMPNAKEFLEARRETIKRLMAARAQMSENQ